MTKEVKRQIKALPKARRKQVMAYRKKYPMHCTICKHRGFKHPNVRPPEHSLAMMLGQYLDLDCAGEAHKMVDGVTRIVACDCKLTAPEVKLNVKRSAVSADKLSAAEAAFKKLSS